MDCKCEVCKSACSYKPGWFRPGEVAKAAALLGMTEQDFFDKYVCVDYYIEDGGEFTFVLAPATVNIQPGTMYPFDPTGKCRLFKDGLCSIHAAKPSECAYYDHDKDNETCQDNRMALVTEWEWNQGEIERLLGKKPVVTPPTLAEMTEFTFKHMLR